MVGFRRDYLHTVHVLWTQIVMLLNTCMNEEQSSKKNTIFSISFAWAASYWYGSTLSVNPDPQSHWIRIQSGSTTLVYSIFEIRKFIHTYAASICINFRISNILYTRVVDPDWIRTQWLCRSGKWCCSGSDLLSISLHSKTFIVFASFDEIWRNFD
jgi:hypothetical protein